jgi:hypothetical protein
MVPAYAVAACGMVMLIAILMIAITATKVRAHDSWIRKGNFGWCCGPDDCKEIDPKDISGPERQICRAAG